MSLLRKIRAIITLTRPELTAIAGLCVVCGEIISLRRLPPGLDAALGFFTGVFIASSAMVTNDYFDLEVDRINVPDRPLPLGLISLAEAKGLTILLSVLGLITAALLNLQSLLLGLIFWAVGFSYNWKLKETGLPGNMMVSASVAVTFLFGGVAVGEPLNGFVWTFATIAFLVNLGEEIAADAMDIEGDLQRGAKTVAKLRGKRVALSLSSLLFLGAIAVSIIPYLARWVGPIYLMLVTITNLVVVYSTYKLFSSQTPEEGRKRIRHIYLAWTFVILAFLVGGLYL